MIVTAPIFCVGDKQVKILSHNLFVYFLMEKKNLFIDFLQKLFYFSSQFLPQVILPEGLSFQHAGSLIWNCNGINDRAIK